MKKLFFGFAALIFLAFSHTAFAQPLLITSTAPQANTLNAATNGDISIDFDAEINLATVHNNTTAANQTTDGNIKIKGSQSRIIQGTWAFSANNSIVAFTPTTDLKAGERITVTVTDEVLGVGAEVATARSFWINAGRLKELLFLLPHPSHELVRMQRL